MVAICAHVAVFAIESFKDMSILKTGNVLLAPERKIEGMEKGSKADTKLFRERLPGWQENYMEHLIKEYMEILSSDGAPSDRFWALEERIKKDRRHPGVILSTGDSPVIYTIIDLMRWNVISFDDLEGFSEVLRNQVHLLQEKL